MNHPLEARRQTDNNTFILWGCGLKTTILGSWNLLSGTSDLFDFEDHPGSLYGWDSNDILQWDVPFNIPVSPPTTLLKV